MWFDSFAMKLCWPTKIIHCSKALLLALFDGSVSSVVPEFKVAAQLGTQVNGLEDCAQIYVKCPK